MGQFKALLMGPHVAPLGVVELSTTLLRVLYTVHVMELCVTPIREAACSHSKEASHSSFKDAVHTSSKETVHDTSIGAA